MKRFMIRNFAFYGTFGLVLFGNITISHAANLYRYTDENGVTTMSKTLPAEFAQQGYDILDDRTMRLIEHVPPALTPQQIAEQEALEAAQAEQARQDAIQAQKAAEAKQKQAEEDRKLLITYPTEADLLSAKESEITYREEQIVFYESKLPALQAKLEKVQKEAADRELSGKAITENMQKRLDSVKEDIRLRQAAIEKFKVEIEALTEKFDADLARHRELLGTQP
jgi:predicted  nucleic acid-binding Zn-ribbon protein